MVKEITLDDVRSNPDKFNMPSEDVAIFEMGTLLRSPSRRLGWERSRNNLVSDYTQGCCGVLAEVLRQRLGWPVVGIFNYKNFKGFADIPCHLGLQNPATGLYVDANGFEQTREQFVHMYFEYHGKDPTVSVIEGPTPFQRRWITHEMCEADLPLLFPERFNHDGL